MDENKFNMESILDSVDHLQEIALGIYGDQNLSESIIWMVEELGEVVAAIRKGKETSEIKGEVGDLIAWIFKISNIFNFKLSDAIYETYMKEANRQILKYKKLKYDREDVACQSLLLNA